MIHWFYFASYILCCRIISEIVDYLGVKELKPDTVYLYELTIQWGVVVCVFLISLS